MPAPLRFRSVAVLITWHAATVFGRRVGPKNLVHQQCSTSRESTFLFFFVQSTASRCSSIDCSALASLGLVGSEITKRLPCCSNWWMSGASIFFDFFFLPAINKWPALPGHQSAGHTLDENGLNKFTAFSASVAGKSAESLHQVALVFTLANLGSSFVTIDGQFNAICDLVSWKIN